MTRVLHLLRRTRVRILTWCLTYTETGRAVLWIEGRKSYELGRFVERATR